ncbi:MAG TPA: hypothetical protein VIG73_10865 [Cerasibacillus sp.]|uniref:hypothetical protein n=1 Tax=Cerasibacillus sp. TaxID=2498711 RepID=UPI002F3EE985
MERQMKGLFYFYTMNIKFSMTVFWSILLGTTIVSILLSMMIVNPTYSMYFSFSIMVYIYSAIIGFHSVKDVLPYAVKVGATRKNIFLSMGIYFLGLALSQALILSVTHRIITSAIKYLDIQTYVLLDLASWLIDDSWLNQILIHTAIIFLLMIVMYIIGLLFYKYGLVGGGIVMGMTVLFMLVGIATGWLSDLFNSILSIIDRMFFIEMIGVTIVIYTLTWLLVRKLTLVR